MARLNVNPTRMELRRLKSRLKTATRGHKLLKDKSDEMVRQFMILIKKNKELRQRVETELKITMDAFVVARAVSPAHTVIGAISRPSYRINVVTGTRNVMGVDVPFLELSAEDNVVLPYALSTATSQLDTAIVKVSRLTTQLLELAQTEKTCNMLADEIEKNRRRVNALEHVMIPQLQETIKYIVMKLDEAERGNLIRIMKVKTMIEARDSAEA